MTDPTQYRYTIDVWSHEPEEHVRELLHKQLDLFPVFSVSIGRSNPPGWNFVDPCGPCAAPWNCYCKCPDCIAAQNDPNRPMPPARIS